MNRYMRFVKHGLAAGAVILALSGVAQASTVDCNIATVTTSTACQIGPGNNDRVSGMNAGLGFFGNNDWLLADKSDSSPLIPGFNLNFTGSDLKLGTWSVGDFGGYTKAVLVVKGGSVAWVAYFLDLTQLSGSWSTADIRNSGGNQPNMSHLSLYVADFRINVVTPVPVPASAVLLLGALGALTALRRRRQKA